MSKNKKKTVKPPIEPPVKKRKYTMPTEYLNMVADRIVSTNPTQRIIFNTLCDVYRKGREDGYFVKQDEAKKFRDRREAVIKELFDNLKDKVEDEIHGGLVESKTKTNKDASL